MARLHAAEFALLHELHGAFSELQAAPRGVRTSSAMIRASLSTNVLVLPLPGPARTTQWPVES